MYQKPPRTTIQNWFATRLVRSKKRVKKLLKRGHLMFWLPEQNAFGWRPGYDYRMEFKCPKCGSSHFGSSSIKLPDGTIKSVAVGHCHGWLGDGIHCDFEWDRETEDVKVFHHTLVKAPEHLRKPSTLKDMHLRGIRPSTVA